ELRCWLIGVGACDGAAEESGLDAEIDRPPHARRTHYVIEGPFETFYSLAIVNRNLAFALDRRDSCTAYIEPTEGVVDYSVDAAVAARLPLEFRKLVRPAPVDAERIVTIRNTYPPRPNGMLGDLRLLHLAWEESTIPEALARMINIHLDGVVVPSKYSK